MQAICRWLALALLLVALASLFSPGFTEGGNEAVRLICLNIGKADCSLLLYRDAAYLIDAGYQHTWPALNAMLTEYGIDRLNGVFLTHCHKDHGGGLVPLARSTVAVDAWYASPIFYDVKAGEHDARLAATIRGTEVEWLDAGQVIPVSADASFTVLGPLTVNEENENNNSLVLRFDSPAGSILLCGDMKEEEEDDLLLAGAFTPCDVLKAGHHGDNKATGKQMLGAVCPSVAVICTDSREEPDTPAASTLTRLKKAGAAVYVTQNAHDAWQITLQNHIVSVEDVSWRGVPAKADGIELKLDMADDRAILINRGTEPLSLDGCFLYSTRGDEGLYLNGFSVLPGETFVIGTKTTVGSANIKWDEKRVWNQKKRDAAILYDAYGRILACTDNGLTE